MAMESATATVAMVSTTMDYATVTAVDLPALEVPASEAAAHVKTEDRGDFEIFFSNTDNVPSEKQMPYIMMMATDCIAGFNAKEVHPYSVFLTNRKLAGGGWVRKLNANKDLVVQELKRRDPTAKPNKSNRGVDEIVQLFKPITDPRDLAFIAKKEGEFRQRMMHTLDECENRKTNRKNVGSDSSMSTPHKRPRIEGDGEKVEQIGGNIEEGSQHLQSNGSITYQAAEKVMAAAEQIVLANRWKVSIAVADANGNPIMVKRLHDAFPASFEIAVGKAKTAAQFDKNTGEMGDAHDVSRGGLAIVIDDICCGGIGVSGQKPALLELVADAGINALKNTTESVQETEGNILDV
eukprot:CAMPEP_0201884820 /NCGR_PEP_ID=MMETSP0902-20130614/17571_1 /ASSEMBLY_ACC=CAM_ASM_000551 /TAXON_ID=420261 /ORGANISM="Thalassiosira antarctica, Strain CCMP982" /LENGTH=350 /DNA_ID=CAMNT_0048413833 /DNA_START=20 /DNA_END=1072 /DNA_ORIENTATION=+